MVDYPKYEDNLEKLYENSGEIDEKSDQLCSWVQIITACFSSFAHGSNDVANAIGPLSAAYQAVTENAITADSQTAAWMLLLGGIGIVIGLATWGWKVIKTVGEKITELTPSRGFSAEFAAAFRRIQFSRC